MKKQHSIAHINIINYRQTIATKILNKINNTKSYKSYQIYLQNAEIKNNIHRLGDKPRKEGRLGNME